MRHPRRGRFLGFTFQFHYPYEALQTANGCAIALQQCRGSHARDGEFLHANTLSIVCGDVSETKHRPVSACSRAHALFTASLSHKGLKRDGIPIALSASQTNSPQARTVRWAAAAKFGERAPLRNAHIRRSSDGAPAAPCRRCGRVSGVPRPSGRSLGRLSMPRFLKDRGFSVDFNLSIGGKHEQASTISARRRRCGRNRIWSARRPDCCRHHHHGYDDRHESEHRIRIHQNRFGRCRSPLIRARSNGRAPARAISLLLGISGGNHDQNASIHA